jgi:hypothetical protein
LTIVGRAGFAGSPKKERIIQKKFEFHTKLKLPYPITVHVTLPCPKPAPIENPRQNHELKTLDLSASRCRVPPFKIKFCGFGQPESLLERRGNDGFFL